MGNLNPKTASDCVKLSGGGTLEDMGLGHGTDQTNVVKDALGVDLTGKYNGRLGGVYVHEGYTATNTLGLPADLIGMRTEIVFNSTNAIVEIMEIKPVPGRVWTNLYDGVTWRGWLSNSYSIQEAFGNVAKSWDAGNSLKLYAKVICESLSNGYYKISGTGILENIVKGNPNAFNNGIDIALIKDMFGLGNITPVGTGIVKYYRRLNGQEGIFTANTEYSGCLQHVSSGCLRFARHYQPSGAVGGWQIGVFADGDRVDFEFFVR